LMYYCPKTIDDANVFKFSNLDVFGEVEDEYGNKSQISYLVLARYLDEEDVYLFACDGEFQTLSDTIHANTNEAKDFAKSYYKENVIWNNI
jgi:hypothetical protein